MNHNQCALFQTSEDAISWMLNHGMIQRNAAKDPETLAPIRGFVLSHQFGQSVGANLLELFAKAKETKWTQLSDRPRRIPHGNDSSYH